MIDWIIDIEKIDLIMEAEVKVQNKKGRESEKKRDKEEADELIRKEEYGKR